jgi:hypothetical protein
MRAIAVLALAVALGAGVLLFPHALEPGRAERDGFALELLQPGTERLASADWYPVSSALRVSRSATGGARIVTDPLGLIQLTSRSLAVLPRACYRLSFAGRNRGTRVRIQVRDEKLRTALGQVFIPRGTTSKRVSLTFAPGDRRRISVLVIARGLARTFVRDLRVDRIPNANCGRD